MSRGFTFEQLAAILIVVLGLIIVVVLIVTQSQNVGKGFSDVSKGVTEQAGDVVPDTACKTSGGTCKAACASGETTAPTALGCSGTTPACCMP